MLEDIAKFRDLFLTDLTVQARIKATATNDLAIKETVKVGKENGLIFTEQQMRDALKLYAETGESPSPICDLPVNQAPFLPDPTTGNVTDTLINSIRDVPDGRCSW